jgi:hypothetical protein
MIEVVKTNEVVSGATKWRHGVLHVAPLKIATAVTVAMMLQPNIRSQ